MASERERSSIVRFIGSKNKCGTHFIRESVLERMVLKHIQLVMGYTLRYRQHFIFVMEQQLATSAELPS